MCKEVEEGVKPGLYTSELTMTSLYIGDKKHCPDIQLLASRYEAVIKNH
jgi:hypothetical protein